ncbi:hypothetical protein GCM10027037_05330 [Mucilaginibacter koreensis]
MFPTINDLLAYLFHLGLPFPVQTFGFFVALAFLAAYQVFTAEFKRYEANGKIHAFAKKVIIGKPASLADLTANFLLGFVLGYKAGGVVWQNAIFQHNPRAYILSGQGNWWLGLIVGLGFAFWVYYGQNKKRLPEPHLIEKDIHPYQLMGRIVIAVGIAGVIGSKLFDVIEHWDLFKYNPLGALFNSTGFAYYGGLLFGALTYLYIGHKHGMKLIHLADIGSPGMMLAYGVGRIGCQLSGDGDWGIVNTHIKPKVLSWVPNWMWSFRFPHNAINAGATLPDCTGNYCNQLLQGVYPTSFYEAVLCIGFFLLMWVLREKIITPGFMFFIYLILNGSERFIIEFIRVNHRYTFGSLLLTQAQIIGLLLIIGGISGFLYRAVKHKSFHKKLPAV